MNDFAMSLLVPLGRTTLLAAGAAVVVFTLLRATRCSSPGLHRLGACLVLLIGWLFLRMPVAIPYYDAPAEEMAVAPAEIVAEPGAWRSSEASPQQVSGGPLERPEDHFTVTNVRPTEIVHEKTEEPTVIPTATIEATPPVAVAPTPRSGRADWPLALLGAWLTGMIALAVCWTLGYIRFMIRLPQGEPAQAQWTRQWDELLSAAGVSRSVPIRMTRRLGPILCHTPGGCRLFLPLELWERLTPAARLSVLRHELAHYRRRDAWKSLAVRILALPHWFNPATWWAVRRFDEAAEWACDQAAADGKEAVAFARTLLDLGEPTIGSGCYGPAARGRGLSVRVRRLLASQTMEDSVMKRLLVGVVALGLVVVCLLQFDLVAKQPSSDAEMAPAEEKTSKPSPPLESLRYDGKSFQQWQDEFATELKPERRAEAIKAFGTFGANGYGKEATEAILDVMREMDMTVGTPVLRNDVASKPLVGPDLIQQTGLRAFVSTRHGYRIPPADALPVLIKELKQGNRNGRLFAISFALENMRGAATPAVPSLLETLGSDEDAIIRSRAFLALGKIDPNGETVVSAARIALKDPSHEVVVTALYALVPQEGSNPPAIFGMFPPKPLISESRYPKGLEAAELMSDVHRYEKVDFHLRLWRELRPEGEKILAMLIEAVNHENHETRLQVIQALGRVGPPADAVVPDLVREFERRDTEERDGIIVAVARMGSAEAEPLLWQTIRDDKRFSMRAAAYQALVRFETLDPQGVPVLIERLRDGDRTERATAACLLMRFGPDAAPAADSLREAIRNRENSGSIGYRRMKEILTQALDAVTAEKAPVPPDGSSGLE